MVALAGVGLGRGGAGDVGMLGMEGSRWGGEGPNGRDFSRFLLPLVKGDVGEYGEMGGVAESGGWEGGGKGGRCFSVSVRIRGLGCSLPFACQVSGGVECWDSCSTYCTYCASRTESS